MPPRKIKVETPGEPDAPDQSAPDQAATEQPQDPAPFAESLAADMRAGTAQFVSPAPAAGQPTEAQLKEALLQEQVAATADLVGSRQALDWSHLTQPALMQQAVKPDPDAKLPDANSIDPSQIPFRQSILTRQGWLLSTAPDPNDRRRY